jgi:hypothetical protein
MELGEHVAADAGGDLDETHPPLGLGRPVRVRAIIGVWGRR